MSYRALTVLGVVSSALLAGGCGTLENLREAVPPKYSCDEAMKTVYGGVRKDCHTLDLSTNANNLDLELMALTACDLPFSAVGDTITLPYTLAFETGVFGLNRVCEFPPPGILAPTEPGPPAP